MLRIVVFLGRVATILFLLWVAVCILMYLFQERIIFHPPEESRVNRSRFKTAEDVEEITLEVEEGIKLRGWFVHGNSESGGNSTAISGESRLIIYFGGNAEEVSYLVDEFRGLNVKGWSAVFLNYRGYGTSDGQPGEKELYQDANKIYDHFQNGEEDFDTVVVMGRSLGTGVATYLAHQRSVDGVILASPFTSLVDVAREMYPFLPAGLLVKHEFDSIGRASDIEAPLNIIVAAEDELIPARQAEKLASGWGGEAEIVEISGEGHNTLTKSPEFKSLLGHILEKYNQ
ncbi:MAG: alpha/beta hydrolase [Halanaerobiaceae bacterium]